MIEWVIAALLAANFIMLWNIKAQLTELVIGAGPAMYRLIRAVERKGDSRDGIPKD